MKKKTLMPKMILISEMIRSGEWDAGRIIILLLVLIGVSGGVFFLKDKNHRNK